MAGNPVKTCAIDLSGDNGEWLIQWTWVLSMQRARDSRPRSRRSATDRKAPHTLRGLPASPGSATAVAAVPNAPECLDPKFTGIIVLKYSSLDWLEAFSRAAGVITELGGVSSHAASICRELGTPCVVSVARATKLIKSGMWLSLDGATGEVRLLPS